MSTAQADPDAQVGPELPGGYAVLVSADVRYFHRLAAAYLRGIPASERRVRLPEPLLEGELDSLSAEEQEELVARALSGGQHIHRFERTQELPRIRQVLGTLEGLAPADLLDVGIGHGTFLWPLLHSFPELPVTAVDRRAESTAWPAAVRRGGVRTLHTAAMDATRLGFRDRSFDVVTLLEVLEHIPDAKQALAEVLRVARRFVVLSVPSREDDNPEHVHLFSEGRLVRMAADAGASRCSIRQVLNHRIMVVRVGGE